MRSSSSASPAHLHSHRHGRDHRLFFESTGPDSSIGSIISGGRLQGVISSFGPIGTIQSMNADIDAEINTLSGGLRNNNGGLTLLQAAGNITGTSASSATPT